MASRTTSGRNRLRFERGLFVKDRTKSQIISIKRSRWRERTNDRTNVTVSNSSSPRGYKSKPRPFWCIPDIECGNRSKHRDRDTKIFRNSHAHSRTNRTNHGNMNEWKRACNFDARPSSQADEIFRRIEIWLLKANKLSTSIAIWKWRCCTMYVCSLAIDTMNRERERKKEKTAL